MDCDVTLNCTTGHTHTIVAVQPWWLAVARYGWIVMTALLGVALFAAVPVNYHYALQLCTSSNCPAAELTPQQMQGMLRDGIPLQFAAAFGAILQLVTGLVFCLVAALIFWRRSHEPVALLGAYFLSVFGVATFTSTATTLAYGHPGWQTAAGLLQLVGQGLPILFFCLFPDGRFVPRWTRWLSPIWVLVLAPSTLDPGSVLDYQLLPPIFALIFWIGALGTVIYIQIYRYRRVSTPPQRQQTKWVVFGLATSLTGFLSMVCGGIVFPDAVNQGRLLLIVNAGIYAFILLIPLSIAVAILRYRLWDVDIFINRALVYGTLTAIVVGLYIIVVGYLSSVLRVGNNLGISLLATGIVAVIFQPLRGWLQRSINRLMYGERDDPYAVLSRLGERLEGTLAPDAILPTIVETITHFLKLPYASIGLLVGNDFSVVAEMGAPPATPLRLPLVYGAETVGQLALAPRVGEGGFSPADRRLLEDLARQAGIAVYAYRLTADLQSSRERLVTAREEERRRLRRDLHDGLGPSLASVALITDAARNLLRHDPAAADALLLGLKDEAQRATRDIRRVVYELRPSVLDELGLVAALRQAAKPYEDGGLAVLVETPETAPPLSAAVEVAAYRIVQEALANVARHADARACTVCVTFTDAVLLEIRDDGKGLSDNRRWGVGTSSMRERAEELGGTFTMTSSAENGTVVTARLPYVSDSE